MGYQIIKCAPDEDLYMEWSSVVDAPTAVGTRAEMLGYLAGQEHGPSSQPETRLSRADTFGSSMRDQSGCFWASDGLMYEQRGFLPRARLVEFARRFLGDDSDDPGVSDLLEG